MREFLERAAGWVLLVLLLGILLVLGLNALTNSRADYATAQGQLRIDSAQAATTILAVMFPWMVVGVVASLSIVVIVALLWWLRPPVPAQPAVPQIETRVLFLPPPPDDMTRRQYWEAWGQAMNSVSPALPVSEKRESA